MGADGGTIPKRCELVKSKKKREKISKDIVNASLWRNCQLSQETLKKPIVACRLGRLYNKEAVLNAILSKKISKHENMKHIRGLKDIKDLKLAENKEFKGNEADKGDVYKDRNIAPFCCPVTSIPMNGNYSFLVNWNCGCVISEKAINEVKSDICHGCGGPLSNDKLIMLNPSNDLLEIYEAKLLKEKELKKNRKLSRESDNLEATSKLNNDKKAVKRKAPSSSIQNDANASAAYKSLFTSCEEAKRKPAAHWVTYNPLFY